MQIKRQRLLKAFSFVVPGFLETGYAPAQEVYKAIHSHKIKPPFLLTLGSGDFCSNLD